MSEKLSSFNYVNVSTKRVFHFASTIFTHTPSLTRAQWGCINPFLSDKISALAIGNPNIFSGK